MRAHGLQVLKLFFQIAHQTIRLPILLADRPEPTNATMLPFYQSGNLETYEPTTMETLKSGDLQNLQAWKINASQPGGPQGAGGYDNIIL